MAEPLTSGRAVALAVVTVVAAAAAAGFSASTASQPVVPLPQVQTDLAPLVGELRALVEALRAERPPTGAPTPRQPIDQVPLLQRIDLLTNALERSGALAGKATPAETPLLTAADRRRPVSWDRLRALHERNRVDPKAARSAMVFSTQRQVLDEYGVPTDVEYDDTNRIYFKYEIVDDDDNTQFGAYFVFIEGKLVEFNFADS